MDHPAPQRRPTHRISPSLSSLSFPSSPAPRSPTGPTPRSAARPASFHQPWVTSPLLDRSGSATLLSGAPGAGNEFEETQNRTFCKWLNTRLEPMGFPPLTDLGKDFADGTRLIQLVEVLTSTSLGRYNHDPILRVQKAENVIRALDTIKTMGVHLTNIGPEDIMDGNRKLILGMIWLLVLRFLIANIDEEGSHAREGLLLWCQRRTTPYAEVDVKNFARSWSDGLAFCALIHRHRPDLIDYDKLSKDPSAAKDNTRLAFQIAETHLAIPRLLEVEDVVDARRPDEKSVMTYVAQFFHAFSSREREETEARVINNFVEHMNGLLVGIHDYERRATSFMDTIAALLSSWRSSPPRPPYASLKLSQAAFLAHKLETKRAWVRERAEISALLGHVQTKLKTYGMRGYEPGEGIRPTDLDERWQKLLEAEADRSREINVMIRQIKEKLRRDFASLANGFERELQALAKALAAVDGPLEAQRATVLTLQTRLQALAAALVPLRATEVECEGCNVEENDYTVYTFGDLEFEYDQLAGDVGARKAFIDNQIVAREMTNVTPEQLEEFESAFRAFDKDFSNTLDMDELVGALGSLGMSDRDVDLILNEAEMSGGNVTFEAFIKFLVDKTEDRLTAAKVRSTFQAAAAEKRFITELDLSRLHLPVSTTEFLRAHMPEIEDPRPGPGRSAGGGDGDEGACYDFTEFLDALLESPS